MHRELFRITPLLDKSSAEMCEHLAKGCLGVVDVETWPDHIEITLSDGFVVADFVRAMHEKGFVLTLPEPLPCTADVAIQGMTCQSCELLIEREWKKISGVESVHADAVAGVVRVTYHGEKPSAQRLQETIQKFGYTVGGQGNVSTSRHLCVVAGYFALALGVLWMLGALGVSRRFENFGANVGFAGAIVIGLFAGSSSCMAVSGGLLLSSIKKFQERYGANVSLMRRMQPVFLFALGRLVSYGVLGGMIGVIGKTFAPAPIVTAAITILAALYMIVMGLDMLGLAPRWLKISLPRMPKMFGHGVFSAEENRQTFSWVAPVLLGAATFFIPCGFTQALQIYALTTGSFFGGAVALGGFALGTLPALVALGFASSSLKGKWGAMFLRFAGALVVVFGLWNIQNGLTIAGYPLALPTFFATSVAVAQDPNVTFDGRRQIIKMKLGADPFYSPSDSYTVQAGVPVRMEIQGIGTGCRSIFQIPKFGVSVALAKPLNVVEFTPSSTGQAVFSCSMGMFRGTLNVVKGS